MIATKANASFFGRKGQIAAASRSAKTVRAGSGWRARYREHLASLLQREARGDQRARFRRRLDDDNAARHARDDAVAAREMPRLRLRAERQFGNDRAALDKCVVEVLVLR